MVTVIADAKYPNMFRVRLDDGATSDMLNHDRAQELARLWAVTPPVRRKPVPVPSLPSDASTVNPRNPTGLPMIIVVSPSTDAEGRRAHSGRGQLFDGRLDGRIIVERSPTPFCEGARVLLAEGYDPAARFIMRHDGSTADALRSAVGVAAKLMVEEGDRVPQFRRWKPSPRADVTPPMRQNEPALT